MDIAKIVVVTMKTILMRIVNVIHQNQHSMLLILTKFISIIRILFVNVDAKHDDNGKYSIKASKMNYKCLNVFIINEHMNLDEIVKVRDATLASVTAVPILLYFGARPMHMKTDYS